MTELPSLRWWNLSQCFTQVEEALERSIWPVDAASAARPLYWDTDEDHRAFTVTNARVSAAATRLGLVPRQVILAPPTPCDDHSWLDTVEGNAIITAARDAGGLRLVPCVWTRQAQQMYDALRREGITIEAEITCPHGRIFHWNSRVGMRELFLSIPQLAPYLPPSLVCHDIHQVRIASARLSSRKMVIKSNFALGGAGTSMLTKDEHFGDLDTYAKSKQKAGFSWAMRDEPTIVEEFIGDAESNLSITVDARQTPAGIAIAGISEQLLIGGFQYAGISSLGSTCLSQHEASLREIAESLGTALARRGYDGWFNFDCVATKAGKLALIDLNVRRSAPLDAHAIVNRLARVNGHIAVYRFYEIVNPGFTNDDDTEERLLRTGLLFDGHAGTIALTAPDTAATTLPLMTIADSDEELKDRLDVLRHTIA